MVQRFVIAVMELVGVALIVAAVVQWSMWLAVALVGVLLLIGALLVERANLER